MQATSNILFLFMHVLLHGWIMNSEYLILSTVLKLITVFLPGIQAGWVWSGDGQLSHQNIFCIP